ncbi:hypothetical protein BC941DRAFT_438481 [Chlamydoabsidia padenii]|nr:hypothetical protein BC941DRAFT_438481 [Chlamydoabsidia padenii]
MSNNTDRPSKDSSNLELVVANSNNKESLGTEIETTIKDVVKSVGRHAHLAFDVESQQLKIDTISVAHTNPRLLQKLEDEKRILDDKNRQLESVMSGVVQGITALATKYQALYTVDIEHVRQNLESGMEKFSQILSLDTLERIRQESIRISDQVKETTDAQDKKLDTLRSSAQSAQQDLKAKIDGLQQNIQTQLNRTDSKVTLNQTEVDTLSTKLSALEKKTQDDHQHALGLIDGMSERVQGQSISTGRISRIISETTKEDRANMLKRMDNFANDLSRNIKLMMALKDDMAALRIMVDKYQQESTAKNKNLSLESPDVITTIQQNGVRLRELEATLNELSSKQKFAESSSSSQADVYLLGKSTFERLEKLSSKITAMESQYQEMTKVAGEKRSHQEMMNGDGLADQIRKLDFKISSMIEYIHQFRSTVLNPDFPTKLDQTLQDLESCLQ